MKSFLVIVLFCFATVLIAQSDTLNRTDSSGKRQGYWKITAAMKKDNSFADQQMICEEGSYSNDLKNGVWLQYYPNGAVKSKVPYVNNRPSGYCILYFENGNVSETGTWFNNHWIGEYRGYYETDTLLRVMHYDAAGRRTGSAISYYPNGKVMIEAHYKNGDEDSIYREYYDDGNLKREMFYANGFVDPARTKEYDPKPGAHWPQKQQSEERNYSFFPVPQGPKAIEVDTKGPDPDRKEYIYDSDGKLIQIKVFKDGVYVGDEPLPENDPH